MMVKRVVPFGRAVGLISAVTLFFAPARAAEQEKTDSLAAQYQGLLKECQAQSLDFRKATTDEERKAAVEKVERFVPRFVELAEKYPRDPFTIEILTQAIRMLNSVDSQIQTSWEMSSTVFPEKGPDSPEVGIFALLLREHLQNEKLIMVCERTRYGIRKEYDRFLREVLKGSPHRDVQGMACLALAQLLNYRRLRLELVHDRPELRTRFEALLGKAYFEELERQDRGKAVGEIEALFEKGAGTYGDVKLPYGGTVGETCRSELQEIRYLAVGKQAPEIEGQDQDGTKFKLSDSIGKVVLLYFWQEL